MAKTILITCASTGFGHNAAETLTRVGHNVFASMRDPLVKNHAHAESLRAAGVNTLELDVTNVSSIEQGRRRCGCEHRLHRCFD